MTTIAVTRPPRWRTRMPKALMIAGGLLAALAGLGWAGLKVQPASFSNIPAPPASPQTVPLPAGLPAPVERFYRQLYGERVPVIRSAVISGRGTMSPVGGIPFPARFRFTHDAGQGYRHYFETTIFGLPIMKVNEYYVGGAGRMEMPWGVDQGERTDQSANLSMWGEVLAWLPSALLTDPRVSWEPVDDVTALLVVPFGQAHERFVVRFDPATGRPWLFELMRYKGAEGEKTLWLNQTLAWGAIGDKTLPARSAVTWADDGKPWLVFGIEDVAYNVDVETAPPARGP